MPIHDELNKMPQTEFELVAPKIARNFGVRNLSCVTMFICLKSFRAHAIFFLSTSLHLSILSYFLYHCHN